MLDMVQKAETILIYYCLGPLVVLLCSKGLKLLQLLGAQTNFLSL